MGDAISSLRNHRDASLENDGNCFRDRDARAESASDTLNNEIRPPADRDSLEDILNPEGFINQPQTDECLAQENFNEDGPSGVICVAEGGPTSGAPQDLRLANDSEAEDALEEDSAPSIVDLLYEAGTISGLNLGEGRQSYPGWVPGKDTKCIQMVKDGDAELVGESMHHAAIATY